MYSTTDSSLPFGQGDIQSEQHDFGISGRVDFEHLKRIHHIHDMQSKVSYTWKRIFKYYTL